MAFEMHLEDLIVLARRGQLTREQERTLEEALSDQPDLLTLYHAGLGFDEEDVLRPIDAETAERIVQNAFSIRPLRRGPKKMRSHTLWLGVGLFFASAVSAAAMGGPLARIISVFQAEESVADESASEPSEGKQLARSRKSGDHTPLHRPLSAEEKESTTEDESPREVQAATHQSPTSPVRTDQTRDFRPSEAGPEGPKTDAESAATLYQQANQARRDGRSADALAHYMLLESHFPGSPQASVALLPAAELLYRAGRYEDALSRFRRYQGPLAPEALWGQARCLRAMGRSDEEQGILRQIRDRYPKSAYAPVVTERLKGQSDITPSP